MVLRDTDGVSATTAMEHIRKAFEQTVQYSDDTEFTVTFSCGLAEFPVFASADEVSIAADKAMYEAKARGRNRVVLASAHADKP